MDPFLDFKSWKIDRGRWVADIFDCYSGRLIKRLCGYVHRQACEQAAMQFILAYEEKAL